ncbi:MAG: aldo/keto reductase [Bacillaceae bacterium]|nr:aldo/keto reductase [Bacillaceae bacterium]
MQRVELRQLGQTSMEISPLGLGCWQFSKGHGLVGGFWPELSDAEIKKIVGISIDGGINWFDTAEIYGNGKSEEALAKALQSVGKRADNVLIATKWWPMFRHAGSIIKTIDNRLASLNGREISLYQVHQPYSFSSVKAEMKAMAKLLDEGKIRSVGVSNYDALKMRDANETLIKYGYTLASNQVKYSLLNRRIETNGVLQVAKENGITIIAYSPLEQGILTGKFHKNPELLKNVSGVRKYMKFFKPEGLKRTQPLIDGLQKLAKEYNVTASQIALNWVIHFHGETIVAIPGASSAKQAKENIGALQFKLSDKHLNLLDDLSKSI